MMETALPAPFIITKAEFLLELLVVALDPPPQLCRIDQRIEGDIFGQGGKPILGRLGLVSRPLDQKRLFSAQLAQQIVAMPHGSSPWAKGPRPHSRRAKREESQSMVPSRQVIVCHASRGKLRARVLTEIGWCRLRCSRVCGRPRPVRDCGGRGGSPGGHPEVLEPIPAT